MLIVDPNNQNRRNNLVKAYLPLQRVASYPKLADVETSILYAHLTLMFDDLLDGLQNVSSHRYISTHVDVPTFLSQALVNSF